MDILTSSELQVAIANILLLVITAIASAISKAVYTFIKTKTSDTQLMMLRELAAAAVNAAEQGAIAGFVTDRKATAIRIVNEGLANAGIKNLTATQIEAAIETAVKETFNFDVRSTLSSDEPTTTTTVAVTPAVGTF